LFLKAWYWYKDLNENSVTLTHLNGHFSGFVFMIRMWVESWEERELESINVLPIISMAIESDKARLELGLDSDLRVGFAAPLARFLVRVDPSDRDGEYEYYYY
jgi:hypothetical protein